MDVENLVSPVIQGSDDNILDATLRPKKLTDFIGQHTTKQNLQVAMSAAKGRGESLDHILVYGPPGLGKTTLANVIAHEMAVSIRTTSGPAIERAGDVAAILTSLEPGDVLFIDEIHRLNRNIEEMLYSAMEDFAIDLIIGKGPSARTLRLDLPKFTLIGATTRIASLSSPLRDRFGMVYRLDFYDPPDIEKIINRSAKILKIDIDKAGLSTISLCARRTPRIANRLLKRVRDYAQVHGNGVVDAVTSKKSLDCLHIDHYGLDEIDRRMLRTIIEKFSGGPVGLSTIAAAIAEEKETIEEVYEPYLIQMGLLERTGRGRKATPHAYSHLGLAPPHAV
ncbi:MAG: Holliday junction branch migration DNA helicase RuvB [bacterium]|nr:Holliday junction branch migration DNA helicase RuvB [bacterium]